MKTPMQLLQEAPKINADDYDCAADWLDACQGEDRERLLRVAVRLRAQAQWQRTQTRSRDKKRSALKQATGS